MKVPHVTPPQWPIIPEGRFARTISKGDPAGCRLAIIGLPDDLGVRLNHGRPGAAFGPTAFRAALARFGTTWDLTGFRELNVPVCDLGDIHPMIPDEGDDPIQALTTTHERVTEALRAVHQLGLIPICIGGGHDLTFPTIRALAQHASAPVAGANIDAHLDVRETVGSGMPFRKLIEGGFLDPRAFSVIGAGRFTNAPEHINWLNKKLTRITTDFTPPRFDPNGPVHRFLSFDLDVLDGSLAPGVSAVNPAGMNMREAQEVVFQAGRDPRIRHFDMMELNPRHDDPAFDPTRPESVGRTARITALLFLTFIAGFAERPA